MIYVGIAVLVVVLAGVVGIIAAIRTIERNFYDKLRSFLSSTGEDGEGKPLPSLFEQMSAVLANKITTSISGSLMGVKSGMSKQIRELEMDAKQSMINESPILSAASSFMPSLAKKSPILLQIIEMLGQNAMSKVMNTQRHTGSGNHTESSMKIQ